MAIKTEHASGVVILVLDGTVDGKAAIELEKTIATHVTTDVRFVVADMTTVQLLTSAGIRQFLLLRKKMTSLRGGLVLCGVNDRVKTLLEIAGLYAQFTVADTRELALARCTPEAAAVPEPPPPTSRIGAMLFGLLGGQDAPALRHSSPQADPTVDALVSRLQTILGSGPGGPAPRS